MAIYSWDAGRYDTTISHLGLKIGDTPSYCNAHGKNDETTFFFDNLLPQKRENHGEKSWIETWSSKPPGLLADGCFTSGEGISSKTKHIMIHIYICKPII